MSTPGHSRSSRGLVTTIIPAYSRAELLRQAVESVLAQTYRPIEVIIVDDGSTDDTGGAADALCRLHPEIIRVIHRSNTGPGPAREAARLEARGEFIQYLDSNDLLLPKKFELQVAGLRSRSECGVSYGKTRNYRHGEPPPDIPWKRTGEVIATMFPAFLQTWWWGTSTPLYRREVTDIAGSWAPLQNEEDWEYDCRVAAQGIKLHYCAEFVSDHRYESGRGRSAGGSGDQSKLRDRASAHALIFQHAKSAGISSQQPEMQRFARELFRLSRKCGAADLPTESAELFRLARTASSPERAKKLDYQAYALLARILGWSLVGRLACASDRLRRRRAKHRHSLVGPADLWRLKRKFQIRFLRAQGLAPRHRLLDLGCGTLRGGIPLIEYLRKGNYWGAEVRERTLEEGRKELREARLEHKEPHLFHVKSLDTTRLGLRFDYIWAFSVFIHLSDDVLQHTMEFVRVHLENGGVCYANVGIGNREEDGSWQGFPLVFRHLAFYEKACKTRGLALEDMGPLKALGHRTGVEDQDNQHMLRITKV